jgi:histidinol dehydrogenase/sulfopropanediol 3-dehydrogenase
VGHFLKVITHQWVDERGVQLLAPYTVRQSAYETMDAHRRAALCRLTNTV